MLAGRTVPFVMVTLECSGKTYTKISDAALHISVKSWHMNIHTQNVTFQGGAKLGLQPALVRVFHFESVEP